MVLLSDRDVVSVPDAWGSFLKAGLCVCYTLAGLAVGEV